MRVRFYSLATLGIVLTALLTWAWAPGVVLLAIAVLLTALGGYDIAQARHAVLRNFPVAGHGRYLMEWLRPMMYQYFIESDTDGVPVNRMHRSLAYQRAKGELDTAPLGTKLNVDAAGYEWLEHSMLAEPAHSAGLDPRVSFGSAQCALPYSASILNISAMSFGALSRHAVLALNGGAAIGGFSHNTGEGGLSPYHLEPGGDIVWQIGTGYFGCRDEQGRFLASAFAEKATLKNVRMIEVKLSQGAKPGHGGLLPAAKNTPEIASIRGVQAGTQVDSPPRHSAFATPVELLEFVARLRELAGGKPVGFKLCLGSQLEFVAICKAMLETGIRPDFVTVDGGEGGTGAAPLEFTNSVGAPLRDAVAFVVDCLVGFGLRDEIRVIASGRMFTAFHIVRTLALGADACNSARAMMLALGCIQSLTCNSNHCPTGIATQDPRLYRGLVVADKRQRVANFHRSMVHAVVELVAATGQHHPSQLGRDQIQRRVSQTRVMRYSELYPPLEAGCLLDGVEPERFAGLLARSRANSFAPA